MKIEYKLRFFLKQKKNNISRNVKKTTVDWKEFRVRWIIEKFIGLRNSILFKM